VVIKGMRYLITGTAGFIGFHLAQRLLDDGHEVFGIDSFTPYYDLKLKEARHSRLVERNRYSGYRIAIDNRDAMARFWSEHEHEIDVVIHLAGQAGVRYSLDQPRTYVDANIVGTFNLLELIRRKPVRHLMLASTSSAYGATDKLPFVERDPTATPMSLYAATKIATEAMAHSYSHLFGQPTTAFRFFTVYGPWGRPDMAAFKFTKGILDGTPIDVYNHGNMSRDFTFIADLVESIVRLSEVIPPKPDTRDTLVDGDSLSPVAPYRTVNIGNNSPVPLARFIQAIERAVGKTAVLNELPMQAGDVPITYADTSLLKALTGYQPSTPIEDGIDAFVTWYRGYHGV
jgi:UDP-glucuronate 4-epimerase